MKLSTEQLLAIVRNYWPSEDPDVSCVLTRTPERERSQEVFFEPLPSEMRAPADLIASRIESRFEATVLPREIAETAIPFYVEPRKPPDTTLFHALFIGDPERVP